MKSLLHSLLMSISLASLLLTAGCPLPTFCGDLLYDEATNKCVCVPGTVPNYELGICEGADGTVIPWAEFDVPYRLVDAGMSMMDSGPRDTSTDTLDAGAADMTLATPDAGPEEGDAGPDVSLDAGVDDTGPDSSSDAGPDSSRDANIDAGPIPQDGPNLLGPHFGYSTGSVHVPSGSPIANHPLRPSLSWEPVDDASYYQVQLTRECGVETFSSCDFARAELEEETPDLFFRPSSMLPVSRTQPVGSRYFWRVRGCSAAGCSDEWSNVRYLDVGRSIADYNGDGYVDVVSSATLRGGSAHVFDGSAAGVRTPGRALGNPLGSGGIFGWRVAAVGDVNADGFGDLVVAAPTQDHPESQEGVAHLFLGGPAGLNATPDLIWDNPSDSAGASFGFALAGPGDLNADGYADVAISAIGEMVPGTSRGVVHFFFGSEIVSAEPNLTVNNEIVDAPGQFGFSLGSIGDIDGDGRVDIAIFADNQDLPSGARGGAVFVLRGSSRMMPLVTLYAPISSDFGQAITGGDLNGDGIADLVVAATGTGQGYIYHGRLYGRPMPTPSATVEGSGSTVSLLDTNGDGNLELVWGRSGASSPEAGEGNVYVYSASDLSGPAVTLDNPLDQAHGGFGSSLGSGGDINGDGYADIVVGAPRQDNPEIDEGNTYVFFGSPAGIARTPGNSLDSPSGQTRVHFGISVQ